MEFFFSDKIEVNGIIEVIDIFDDTIGPGGFGLASNSFEDERGTGGVVEI